VSLAGINNIFCAGYITLVIIIVITPDTSLGSDVEDYIAVFSSIDDSISVTDVTAYNFNPQFF